METSTEHNPSTDDRLVALRRWRGLIAAQVAYFDNLSAAHREEAARGLLPQGELDWVQKEIRGWGRHLDDLDGRIGVQEAGLTPDTR